MGNKKITLSVGPSVIILALLVLGGIVLLRTDKGRHRLSIEDSPVIATRIRTLGELTTACFYDEIVLTGTKKNLLSASPLGSLAREGFGKDVDDHLVIIARGTVRSGIDLQKMEAGDVRISGDTVILRLPPPQYLDVIVNPSDIEVFAESGKWTQQQMSGLQESARRKLVAEADHAGLKRTAYEGAMEAVSDLLLACGYTYIRFDHPASYVPLPGAEGY